MFNTIFLNTNNYFAPEQNIVCKETHGSNFPLS